MKFSIGYNYDLKLLSLLDVYRDNIESLYFPIPQIFLGSGRCILEPKGYLNQIPQIIKKCNSLEISSSLLVNATWEGEKGLSKSFFKKLLDYIRKLKELGLKSLVLTNPVYISKVKEEIKDIRIESSVNCYVKTVEHALYLKDLGVDVLTVDRDINRNIPLIKEIKERTSLKIRIMLNEGCLRNCPFRVMHYNYLSQKTNPSVSRPMDSLFVDAFCIQIYLRNPAKIFSVPFIPPDTLKYYISFVDYYKLSTRVFSTSRIELTLKAYINQDFKGNLLKILDCPGLSYFEYIDYRILKKNNFFEKMLSCSQRCESCDYCEFLIKRATLIGRGYLKRNKREEKKAVRLYRDALKISSDSKPSLYTGLSQAYFNLEEYRRAFRLADKVIKIAPKDISGYLLLGSYYEQLKKMKSALEVYKKSLKFFPSEATVYLRRAEVYFQLKKYRRAIKNINKVLHLKHEGIGIHYLLGSCYQRLKKYKKAIEEFKKEQRLNPKDSKVNFSLAKCYQSMGKPNLANKELDRGFYKSKNERNFIPKI